ncbi:MAG: MliC family protein [Paracoccus hibiscisoli]|uniref:MliC family protein n=1 Tax=Paracoccus hibiscisoli TaxID=2023261 RepID=UPI00391CD6A4
MRPALALILPLLTAMPATAQPLLSWPLGPDMQAITATMACDNGSTLSVTYLNGPRDSLALLDLSDGPTIFAGVIAASGARYAAGAREWWVKGDSATLTDSMAEDDPITCTIQN